MTESLLVNTGGTTWRTLQRVCFGYIFCIATWSLVRRFDAGIVAALDDLE